MRSKMLSVALVVALAVSAQLLASPKAHKPPFPPTWQSSDGPSVRIGFRSLDLKPREKRAMTVEVTGPFGREDMQSCNESRRVVFVGRSWKYLHLADFNLGDIPGTYRCRLLLFDGMDSDRIQLVFVINAFSKEANMNTVGVSTPKVEAAGVKEFFGRWQYSMMPEIQLGVRDKYGELGRFRAQFSVKDKAGKSYGVVRDVVDANKFCYAYFPSDFGATFKPGNYKYSRNVAGNRVFGGRKYWFSLGKDELSFFVKNR